jgi:hypothetical protein
MASEGRERATNATTGKIFIMNLYEKLLELPPLLKRLFLLP